ncbi:MAG: type IV toxin-antitoxin system AbiEi family antitoxin [candidate division FCPU426 bacterium]
MLMRRQLQNIFSDCSSLILRALFREPQRHWRIPELARLGVSFGMASIVLNRAESLGYVERVRTGPGSYSRLADREHLLEDWTRHYSFERNWHAYYYYPRKDFLPRLREVLERRNLRYALTLFSASRLISPYVKDDRHFVYLDITPQQAKAVFRELEADLGLMRLVRGGNICLAIPFYHHSVFKTLRHAKGYPVVSNLQLYLDLMGFAPSGPEEAKHLLSHWKKQEELLA